MAREMHRHTPMAQIKKTPTFENPGMSFIQEGPQAVSSDYLPEQPTNRLIAMFGSDPEPLDLEDQCVGEHQPQTEEETKLSIELGYEQETDSEAEFDYHNKQSKTGGRRGGPQKGKGKGKGKGKTTSETTVHASSKKKKRTAGSLKIKASNKKKRSGGATGSGKTGSFEKFAQKGKTEQQAVNIFPAMNLSPHTQGIFPRLSKFQHGYNTYLKSAASVFSLCGRAKDLETKGAAKTPAELGKCSALTSKSLQNQQAVNYNNSANNVVERQIDEVSVQEQSILARGHFESAKKKLVILQNNLALKQYKQEQALISESIQQCGGVISALVGLAAGGVANLPKNAAVAAVKAVSNQVAASATGLDRCMKRLEGVIAQIESDTLDMQFGNARLCVALGSQEVKNLRRSEQRMEQQVDSASHAADVSTYQFGKAIGASTRDMQSLRLASTYQQIAAKASASMGMFQKVASEPALAEVRYMQKIWPTIKAKRNEAKKESNAEKAVEVLKTMATPVRLLLPALPDLHKKSFSKEQQLTIHHDMYGNLDTHLGHIEEQKQFYSHMAPKWEQRTQAWSQFLSKKSGGMLKPQQYTLSDKVPTAAGDKESKAAAA